MYDLPRGWAEVTFADVVEVNPRKSVDLSADDIVTFVPMAAVDEITGVIAGPIERPLKEVNKGFTQFAENDVIFAKITPSMENGKSAVALGLANGIGFGSTEFHVFRSKGAVLPAYLWHFVRQQEFRDNAQHVMSGAVGQQRVPADYLKGHLLPLPPFAEQNRIVAKIDSLIDRTTRARDSLGRIPAMVAKYKARILELATSGTLTRDWRFARNLPKWKRVNLGSVAKSFNYGTSAKSSTQGRVPVLRMGNIQDGQLDWSDLVFTSIPEEIEKYRLAEGDVLFNRTNSPELVGKTAVFKGGREAIFAGYLIRVRCGDELIPDYLGYCLNSPHGRRYSWQVKSDGVSQSNINAKKLADFEFLLPSTAEQIEVVQRIESAFAWLDRIIADHTAVARLLPNVDFH
ncbi:restriction endonuclease subunit S [Agrobacterium tumefaciens]|uniref:restriction endonuclease subunit S n=1 Tax=Agrobacterium tumefaciens TaxID=358 RepID=UPI003B9FADC6